ncbi:SPOR domain-containing protein [Caballeronia sp. LZ062]|uniref:SPOR domain-containing protein n=1 Tax=unclassified Caballeronia TaxID=2646786 RepID=UPI00285F82AE|nr:MULTISPECIES: SPOR domain-containing protein [unclassified Caballeronia]MDR5856965.1 SPOR domain-containing protein [Caballeronia sp. LZ050]MDR5869638.1 SPOR domain-containing protein [Caballeronia sp. LZ062]
MGLFSFGKKDDARAASDAYPDSPRGSRHTVRTERRTRRTERPDADAMMLDPTLPEKQRARRRLVGAIALVLAAVIVLPMVLDSRPKPVADDISIDIPNRAAPAAKPSREANDADTQAGVAHETPAAADSTVAAGVTQPSPPASASAAVAQTKPEAKAESKPAPIAKQAAKPQAQPAPETDSTASPATPASSAANTPSSPAGSRFVLQIGTFDDDTAAQNWVNKLKAAGVPAYLEHRQQSDGSSRALLRAGPFPDRASASAALVKVRQAGLAGGKRSASN